MIGDFKAKEEEGQTVMVRPSCNLFDALVAVNSISTQFFFNAE